MSLLPIDPADFPDVPTRKALLALDLQNDFLADDGALPVHQPDGMIDRVVRLAEAVRASGYGEIVWVRSQFDTDRPADEQQIMAAETPQLPTRPGAAAARARNKAPPTTKPLDADPEAFLSVAGAADGEKKKALCVRKGTSGVAFLPAIAAAKGPLDYAMVKSYYSAFESGSLLKLLRGKFATELFICGSLSNVSVYATALAASSYGFEITVVEDCCGYRSEMRHMNAARRLMEQTGCEFRNLADVLPNLRPKTPSPPVSAKRTRPPTRGPPQIPPELIAAAMAGSKGLPVRPKPASPSPNPAHSTAEGAKEEEEGPKTEGVTAPTPSPPLSPPQLAVSLARLTLSANSPGKDKTGGPEPADKTSAGKAGTLLASENAPSHHEAEQPIQSVVKEGTEAENVNARDNGSNTQQHSAANKLGGPGAPGAVPRSPERPSAEASSGSGTAATTTGTDGIIPADVSDGTKLSDPKLTKEFIVSDELLMAPTPEFIMQEVRARGPETRERPGPIPIPVKPDSLHLDAQQLFEEEVAPESPKRESATDTTRMPKDKGSKDNKTYPVALEEGLCEGETTLTENFLPPALIEDLFETLCEEVHFRKMRHLGGEVPRFVAVQGSIEEDGTQPVYRHPSDESPPLRPFTPAVQKIRDLTAKALGHPLNHVLIQCYRNGNDYISEHSDKTLDIFRWSFIANVSIGAQRTMVFRSKRGKRKQAGPVARDNLNPTDPDDSDAISIRLDTYDKAAPSRTPPSPPKRQTIRCPMPHNSLIKMGLVTNEKWLHCIKADKRPAHEKSPAELAWNGARISLTFRYISTFLTPTPSGSGSDPLIWGQGATSKTREAARLVLNGQSPEAVALLRAFGRENNSPEFDWEANYGRGFDVLHMKSEPRFFGSGDALVDGRVRITLAECGLQYAKGDIGSEKDTRGGVGEVIPVRFEVDDAERTTVVGDIAILLYLDAKHPKKRGDAEVARVYSRLYGAVSLEQAWRRWRGDHDRQAMIVVEKQLRPILADFEAWCAETTPSSGTIAGGAEPSVADYALWPVLHDVARAWKKAASTAGESSSSAGGSGGGSTVFDAMDLPALDGYYAAFAARKSVVGMFGEGAADATRCEEPARHAQGSDVGGVTLEEFGVRPGSTATTATLVSTTMATEKEEDGEGSGEDERTKRPPVANETGEDGTGAVWF